MHILQRPENLLASPMLGKILDVIQTRYLLNTTIVLLDGRPVIPAQSIPIFTVYTTFASYNYKSNRNKLMMYTNNFLVGFTVGKHEENTVNAAGGVLDWYTAKQL